MVKSEEVMVIAAMVFAAMADRLSEGSGGDGITCPGSAAPIHAYAKSRVNVYDTCKNVAAEIVARAGKNSDGWKDPNGGIYGLKHEPDFIEDDLYEGIGEDRNEGVYAVLKTARSSNPDKNPLGNETKNITLQVFTLFSHVTDCIIEACSASQRFSLMDSSTNYCSIRNLYCGTEDGCSPVTKDFRWTKLSVTAWIDLPKRSLGAGKDWSKCGVKLTEKEAKRVWESKVAKAKIAAEEAHKAAEAAKVEATATREAEVERKNQKLMALKQQRAKDAEAEAIAKQEAEETAKQARCLARAKLIGNSHMSHFDKDC